MPVKAMAILVLGLSPQVLAPAMAAPAMQVPRSDIVYDADPTGVRDSAAVLQKTIDTKHGFWLFPGRYRLSKPLVLRDNSVLAANAGTVTLVADPANAGAGGGLLLVGKGVRDVAVQGIDFDGQISPAAPLPASRTRLVYIDGGKNVVFDDGVWRNSNGSALVFSGASGPVVDSGVRHSHFANLGFGWRSPGRGALNETAPVVVFANGLAANNHGNFVTDNEISDVGSDAVSIQQQSHFVAEHNRLTLGQAGWRPSSPATAVTYGIGGFYVSQRRGTPPNRDVVLRGNVVHGATGNCFDLTSTDQLTVVDNVADHCGGAGVSLGYDISNFTVTANTLTHNFQSEHYAYRNISHRGSLSFSCGKSPCTAVIRDGSVVRNIFDDQGRRSQPIDVWQQAGVSLIDVQTDVPIRKDLSQQAPR